MLEWVLEETWYVRVTGGVGDRGSQVYMWAKAF